jgi:glycosyltransferase involved in cell wall biosynthesis
VNKLGIVVIGRNEGERLIRCLESVRSNAKSIVYVDSGSTDGSASAAEQLGVFVLRLDLARPFTAARARNEGFAALKALAPDVQFVQFVDGDCELADGWLDTALAFITLRKQVALVCGRRRERHPEMSIYNRLCDLEWDTPIGEASACGGDSLLRVEAFEAVGGFRPQLIAGEEPELCVRLREKGWKIWRLDAEMTRHDAGMTRFRQWWVRTVRFGYGAAEISWLDMYTPSSIPKRDKRDVGRAVIWSGLVPLVIGVAAFNYPAALLGALIYPLHICWIALRRGATEPQSWTYALFMVIAKFAQLQGNLKFCWHLLYKEPVGLIEYKQSS